MIYNRLGLDGVLTYITPQCQEYAHPRVDRARTCPFLRLFRKCAHWDAFLKWRTVVCIVVELDLVIFALISCLAVSKIT